MPEPPQLTPFDTKEQRLDSKLPPDVRAPYPISKGEPGHPAEEAHFGRLYSRSRSFGHDPEFVTIGEGWNIDRPVNGELRLPAQLLFTRTDQYSACFTAAAAPIRLSISRSTLPSLVNKTPRYLNSFAWGRQFVPTWREQSTGFRQSTMASDLEVLTLIPAASHSAANLPVNAGGHGPRAQTGPHHLRTAERRSRDPRTGKGFYYLY